MRARPVFACYSNTYLHRTENFTYRQIGGLHAVEVAVLAQWGANLAEFPVSNLFLAEASTTTAGRVWNALVRRVSKPSSRHALASYARRRLAQRLRAINPDLAYCIFGWNATQLHEVLDASHCRDTSLVFHLGGSDITSAESLGAEYVERLHRAAERATLILCGSQFLVDTALRFGMPAEKLRLHYLGIDVPDHLEQRADSEQVLFLAVSRLLEVKGPRHTIRAFAMAAPEMPHARLELIGGGPDFAACQELARDLGVDNRIVFHGEKPLGDVYRALNSADIFVQHNIRSAAGQEEGLGGSILEAAAHGLPTIGTSSGGVSEGVHHEKTGLLVTPGDEQAMATAMVRLYSDPMLRKRLGSAARELIRAQFDINHQNRKLEALLLQVAASRQGAGDVRNNP